MKTTQFVKSNLILPITAVLTVVMGSACNSNNTAALGPCGSATCTQSISPDVFVQELVNLANAGVVNANYAKSTVAKEVSANGYYFVIWDSRAAHYVAIEDTYLYNLIYRKGAAVTGLAQYDGANFYGDPAANTYGAATGGRYSYWVNKIGTDTNGQPLFKDSNGNLYSRGAQTKDVDLQQAEVQSDVTIETAASVSARLQMSFESALSLVTLSDKIKTVYGNRGLTSEDRQAIQGALLDIAGLTQADMDQAVAGAMKGDNAALNGMLSKAATHLGMPSSEHLKNEILPALGIQLSN